ncbi:hypothetical protein DFH09DRAFT_1178301 [Mycena vulgaris]|nr:hypothetical protein DFH09DRAFT_1178301 [Mycena vulgaris]
MSQFRLAASFSLIGPGIQCRIAVYVLRYILDCGNRKEHVGLHAHHSDFTAHTNVSLYREQVSDITRLFCGLFGAVNPVDFE